MITPSVNCQIQSTKSKNLFGEEALSAKKEAWCCVVKLVSSSERTSVRADSSASRGAGDEIVSSSRLLFLPVVKIEIGDKVTVAGLELLVSSIRHRFSVRGALDHFQVDLTSWV